MDVRGSLNVDVLPGNKVCRRDLGPCAREDERERVSVQEEGEELALDVPAGTSASSVTSNSATRILGSTPALRN